MSRVCPGEAFTPTLIAEIIVSAYKILVQAVAAARSLRAERTATVAQFGVKISQQPPLSSVPKIWRSAGDSAFRKSFALELDDHLNILHTLY